MRIYTSQSNAGIRESKTYIIANAKMAIDFTNLKNKFLEVAEDIDDFTNNGHNAIKNGIFLPKVGEAFLDSNVFKAALCQNSNALKTAFITEIAATTLFNDDFEIHTLFNVADAQSTDTYLFGLSTAPSKKLYCYINATGNLAFYLNIDGSIISEWVTTTFAFGNIHISPTYLRIKCDFTNDILKMWVNGIEVSLTLTGNALTDTDPSGFTSSVGIAIGGVRTGADTILAASAIAIQVFKFCITPVLTEVQAAKVGHFISYLKL